MNFRTIAAFSAGSIIAALLSFIMLPLAAWLFSAEDIGRLALLQIVVTLSTTLLSLQLHQAYVREYHEEIHKNILFYVMTLPGLGLAFAACFVMWLLPSSITAWLFESSSPALIALLSLCVISAIAINSCAHVVRMEERGAAFFISQTIPKALPIFALFIIFIAKIPRHFIFLISAISASYLASALILSYLTRSSWINFKDFRWDTYLSRRMLQFSLPLVIAGFAQWGLWSSDRFFVKNYAGLYDLGIYSMASAFAGAGMVLSMIFGNIWHPTVYKWINAGKPPEQIYRVSSVVLVIISLIWSLGAMTGPLLMHLLPSTYQGLERIFLPCLAAPLIFTLSESTMIGIGIMRRSWIIVTITCCTFIMSIACNWLFVPKYGAIAAAIISMLVFFFLLILKTEASCRLWFQFHRLRLYFIILLYIICTMFFSIDAIKIKIATSALTWGGLFILSFSLFRNDIKWFHKTQIQSLKFKQ